MSNGSAAVPLLVRNTRGVGTPNCTLLLSLLKNQLKDGLSRYEIPLAIALVDGPWTPESGKFPILASSPAHWSWIGAWME